MNHNLQRVLVVGSSCAGKTTFARRLSQQLDADYVELDALHWGPDWTPAEKRVFREKVAEAVSGENWISDGNYFSVRDLAWSRATTLIWLDYPFHTVFGRALRRTIRRAFFGERIYSGNRETFRMAFFSRDSILRWVITSYRPVRKQLSELLTHDENSHLEVIRFRKPSDAERFLSAEVPSAEN